MVGEMKVGIACYLSSLNSLYINAFYKLKIVEKDSGSGFFGVWVELDALNDLKRAKYVHSHSLLPVYKFEVCNPSRRRSSFDYFLECR